LEKQLEDETDPTMRRDLNEDIKKVHDTLELVQSEMQVMREASEREFDYEENPQMQQDRRAAQSLQAEEDAAEKERIERKRKQAFEEDRILRQKNLEEMNRLLGSLGTQMKPATLGSEDQPSTSGLQQTHPASSPRGGKKTPTPPASIPPPDRISSRTPSVTSSPDTRSQLEVVYSSSNDSLGILKQRPSGQQGTQQDSTSSEERKHLEEIAKFRKTLPKNDYRQKVLNPLRTPKDIIKTYASKEARQESLDEPEQGNRWKRINFPPFSESLDPVDHLQEWRASYELLQSRGEECMSKIKSITYRLNVHTALLTSMMQHIEEIHATVTSNVAREIMEGRTDPLGFKEQWKIETEDCFADRESFEKAFRSDDFKKRAERYVIGKPWHKPRDWFTRILQRFLKPWVLRTYYAQRLGTNQTISTYAGNYLPDTFYSWLQAVTEKQFNMTAKDEGELRAKKNKEIMAPLKEVLKRFRRKPLTQEEIDDCKATLSEEKAEFYLNFRVDTVRITVYFSH
jgi:phage gpG-like protein